MNQESRDRNRYPWHKTCAICGKPFEARSNGAKICSPECRAVRFPDSAPGVHSVSTYAKKKHGDCAECRQAKKVYQQRRAVDAMRAAYP